MLTDRQTMQLLSLGVLMGRASDLMEEVLSPFERTLVLDIAGRFVRDRSDAVITDVVWVVVGDVVDCLRAHVFARIAAAEAAEAAA